MGKPSDGLQWTHDPATREVTSNIHPAKTSRFPRKPFSALHDMMAVGNYILSDRIESRKDGASSRAIGFEFPDAFTRLEQRGEGFFPPDCSLSADAVGRADFAHPDLGVEHSAGSRARHEPQHMGVAGEKLVDHCLDEWGVDRPLQKKIFQPQEHEFFLDLGQIVRHAIGPYSTVCGTG